LRKLAYALSSMLRYIAAAARFTLQPPSLMALILFWQNCASRMARLLAAAAIIDIHS
jgi:hypothetical protein